MQFYEFGKENKTTLVLIHGMSTTWKMSFASFIELARNQYHIIAVSLDGHDPEEQTEFVSLAEEAEKVEKYLQENYDGKVDIIYGASLGGAIVFKMLMNENVQMDIAIADGTTLKNYGILAKLSAKVVTAISAKLPESDFLIKAMGYGSREFLAEKMYTGASKNTIYNCLYEYFTFDTPENYSGKSAVYLWYGSKEKDPPKFAAKLKEKNSDINSKAFDGYGHGTILEHPDVLLSEIAQCRKMWGRKE